MICMRVVTNEPHTSITPSHLTNYDYSSSLYCKYFQCFYFYICHCYECLHFISFLFVACIYLMGEWGFKVGLDGVKGLVDGLDGWDALCCLGLGQCFGRIVIGFIRNYQLKAV